MFHALFGLATLFIMMTLTNWYSPGKMTVSIETISANMSAVWVKIISAWLCFGIYMWTPKSNRYKLVRVEPVFYLLPLTHRQAVMSYVCCMASLEMEAFNEYLKPDDPTRMVINL